MVNLTKLNAIRSKYGPPDSHHLSSLYNNYIEETKALVISAEDKREDIIAELKRAISLYTGLESEPSLKPAFEENLHTRIETYLKQIATNTSVKTPLLQIICDCEKDLEYATQHNNKFEIERNKRILSYVRSHPLFAQETAHSLGLHTPESASKETLHTYCSIETRLAITQPHFLDFLFKPKPKMELFIGFDNLDSAKEYARFLSGKGVVGSTGLPKYAAQHLKNSQYFYVILTQSNIDKLVGQSFDLSTIASLIPPKSPSEPAPPTP